jgi:type I restriction enzyme S subunit
MKKEMLNTSARNRTLKQGWIIQSVESVCLRITSGGTPSRKEPSFFANGEILWVKSSELKDYYIRNTSEKITKAALDNSSAKLLPRNTVLIALYGDGRTITSLGILPGQAACNQACCAVICDDNLCYFKFMFYSLKYHREELIALATGASQRNLSGKLIRSFAIAVPPLQTQLKIASILSAYDDLIENNTRRIAILEEMSQRLYKEWFVNFKFPGHETAKFVDSTLGMIPEGWRVLPLKDVSSKIGSGATPKGGKNSYRKSGISLIRSLNVYDNHFEFKDLAYISEKQATQLDNVRIEKYDVLLNITGASVARCCIVPSSLIPARVNQHVAIIRVIPDMANPFFLLNTINNEHHKQQILALAQGGATREALTKETICNYKIVLPEFSLLREYGLIAADLFGLSETLQRKNQNLRKTRDMLLPKLISGELDVENLDIDTGEAFVES